MKQVLTSQSYSSPHCTKESNIRSKQRACPQQFLNSSSLGSTCTQQHHERIRGGCHTPGTPQISQVHQKPKLSSMSDTHAPEAAHQVVVDATAMFQWVSPPLWFMCMYVSALTTKFNPHLTFMNQVHLANFWITYIFSLVLPMLVFFQYHSVAPPTWLTFGHSIALGGTTPDICSDALQAMSPSGHFECSFEDLEIWFANTAGPQVSAKDVTLLVPKTISDLNPSL